MDEMPGSLGTPDEPDTGGQITGTPRWVKVFGAVALVVVAVFVLLLLVRGGDHGPGRHSGGGSDGPVHTGPPAGVTHTQP